MHIMTISSYYFDHRHFLSVVDAILGALNLPDIGQIFPDNDAKWKGADSSIFMEEVANIHK